MRATPQTLEQKMGHSPCLAAVCVGFLLHHLHHHGNCCSLRCFHSALYGVMHIHSSVHRVRLATSAYEGEVVRVHYCLTVSCCGRLHRCARVQQDVDGNGPPPLDDHCLLVHSARFSRFQEENHGVAGPCHPPGHWRRFAPHCC